MKNDSITPVHPGEPSEALDALGHATPVELDTDEVLSFVVSALPPAPASILEVGCGHGHLGAELAARGWRVKAVDRDPEAVAAARGRGVDAACADLLDFSGGPFAAVLCTRSLHHIWPLDAAVAKLHALTAPDGTLVLDEFAHDEADLATAEWLFDAGALLEEAGVLEAMAARHHHHAGAEAHSAARGPHGVDRGAAPPDHAVEAAPPATPLDRWRRRLAHDPPLHGGQDMLDAIGAAFDIIRSDRGPCLYRYFSDRLEPNERGARIFRRMRALEDERIASGSIVPIGLRVVARRR